MREGHGTTDASCALQVWSWVWENGRYRVAPLAETSATSTESNAIQARRLGCLSWCMCCLVPRDSACHALHSSLQLR